MKITPIEIRQHTFEKGLRGYRPEDVDAFLVSLSQEWERVIGDHKMLKMQLELAEKELGKLKEVEMTLFRTLKTAEDTSTQITDQANKAAEQYLAEARQKADDILADARKRSALMVQDAENQARYLKDNILNDLKALEHDFRALEGYKENLAVQIRALAGNAIDSVDRFEKKFGKHNIKGKIDEVATQITDELKQYEATDKADHEAPANVSYASNGAAIELPALTEREKSIPGAIPVDESLIGKLDEAIEQGNHTQANANTSPADSTDATQPISVQASGEHTNGVEPVATAANQPEPVGQESEPKKGGSFFDHI